MHLRWGNYRHTEKKRIEDVIYYWRTHDKNEDPITEDHKGDPITVDGKDLAESMFGKNKSLRGNINSKKQILRQFYSP